jgi:hypothetical protein
MEVVYRRCCGIDVHKDFVTACVLVNEPGKPREVRKKEFRTYWSDLQKGNNILDISNLGMSNILLFLIDWQSESATPAANAPQ